MWYTFVDLRESNNYIVDVNQLPWPGHADIPNYLCYVVGINGDFSAKFQFRTFGSHGTHERLLKSFTAENLMIVYEHEHDVGYGNLKISSWSKFSRKGRERKPERKSKEERAKSNRREGSKGGVCRRPCQPRAVGSANTRRLFRYTPYNIWIFSSGNHNYKAWRVSLALLHLPTLSCGI